MNALLLRDEETGNYKDSEYYAASLRVHQNPTAIPILDSPDDGMLHVVSGWNGSTLFSDLCYRFTASCRWNSASCGFLRDSTRSIKRRYKCKGLMVCPLIHEFNLDFRHGTESDWALIAAQMAPSKRTSEILEMQCARSLCLNLTKENRTYCRYSYTPPGSTTSIRCPGTPMMRSMRTKGEKFIGCSHYHHYRFQSTTPHRFVSLRDFGDQAISYIQKMIAESKPLSINGDKCNFIAGKKHKNISKCPIHQIDLVSLGAGNAFPCEHVMLTVEKENSGVDNLVYALCRGRHNHPPPPQAYGTSKKASIFRVQAGLSPDSSASILKLRRTQSDIRSSSSAPSMSNLGLDKNMVRSSVQNARKRIYPYRDDFASLFSLSIDEPYIRDARCIQGNFIVLLAHVVQLEKACIGMVFGADFTYKTICERSPNTLGKNTPWYLYKIVIPNDVSAASKSGVVMTRALMTSQTMEAYETEWTMFLHHLNIVKARMLMVEVNEIAFHLPYLNLEPSRRLSSVAIRAITTDFEIPEIKGIAAAIASACGGHMKLCSEAPEHMANILALDSDWGSWATNDFIRSLLGPALSKMNSSIRSTALGSTNIVESQNRRGHLLCGIQQCPVVCVQKLRDIDNIGISIANMESRRPTIPAMKTRPRVGSMLAPASQPTSKRRKRSLTKSRLNQSTICARRRRNTSENCSSTETPDSHLSALMQQVSLDVENITGIENAGLQAFLRQIYRNCETNPSVSGSAICTLKITSIRNQLKERLMKELSDMEKACPRVLDILSHLIQITYLGERNNSGDRVTIKPERDVEKIAMLGAEASSRAIASNQIPEDTETNPQSLDVEASTRNDKLIDVIIIDD